MIAASSYGQAADEFIVGWTLGGLAGAAAGAACVVTSGASRCGPQPTRFSALVAELEQRSHGRRAEVERVELRIGDGNGRELKLRTFELRIGRSQFESRSHRRGLLAQPAVDDDVYGRAGLEETQRHEKWQSNSAVNVNLFV
jgi:hypothetical protein